MNASILQLSEDAYHADPCDVPSLSSSIAHTLVSKSPAHAWLEHPKLGAKSRRPTKTMDNGSLVHKLLLGSGADVVLIEADDYKTKAAREARDAAHEAGKIPMLVKKYEEIEGCVGVLREKFDAKGIKLCGRSEATVLWTEEARDGTQVKCRGRIDHIIEDDGIIYDLKTTACACPDKLDGHMYEYGYDIQIRAYTRALECLRPEHEGRVQFMDIFVELEPPYAVTRVRPAGSMLELGKLRWERAVNLWARCTRDNWWPDYEESPVWVEARSYHLSEAMSLG